MHIHIVFAFLTTTLISVVLSSPAGLDSSDYNQVILGSSSIARPYQYVDGELPPTNDTEGWIDPRLNGGRLLDFTTKRLGEPLNVIISSLSDPFILSETGLHIYAKSIGFSEECLGLHYGHLHEADLGDGLGRKQEHFLARQHYFPIGGTCWESVRGGHHFRAWRQNGTLANSGAWFIGLMRMVITSDAIMSSIVLYPAVAPTAFGGRQRSSGVRASCREVAAVSITPFLRTAELRF
ncbi:unnamed protein product [Somion occarium]|uniref:Uncharacterized protein n=1 Tax=Somion occarium TaxID=3059160 RepID=A0ABP1DWH8_9APHY